MYHVSLSEYLFWHILVRRHTTVDNMIARILVIIVLIMISFLNYLNLESGV